MVAIEEIGDGDRIVSGHRRYWGTSASALIVCEAGAGRAWGSRGMETKASRLPRTKIRRRDLGLGTLCP